MFLCFLSGGIFHSISQSWICSLWTVAIRGSALDHCLIGFLTWTTSYCLCHLISFWRSGSHEGQFFSTLAFILSILSCPGSTYDLEIGAYRICRVGPWATTTNHLLLPPCFHNIATPNPYLTLWRLQFFYKWRRLSTYTRSSSTPSFRSTLSTTQTGTTIFRRASGSCPTFPLHLW